MWVDDPQHHQHHHYHHRPPSVRLKAHIVVLRAKEQTRERGNPEQIYEKLYPKSFYAMHDIAQEAVRRLCINFKDILIRAMPKVCQAWQKLFLTSLNTHTHTHTHKCTLAVGETRKGS